MPQEPVKFFINRSAKDPAKALVGGLDTIAPAENYAFSQADDSRPAELHFVRNNPAFAPGLNPFVYTTAPDSAELGAGEFDKKVDAGTFAVTESAAAQTASGVAFNVTTAALQTALRAAWTTHFSNCVVSGTDGGPWTVNLGANGTYSGTISGNTAGITPPESVLEVTILQTGTASRPAIFQLQLLQPPAILGDFTVALPSAAVNVASTVTGSAGVNAVQTVTWNADAWAGSVSLTLAIPTGGGITTATLATPSVVSTTIAHNLKVGDSIVIAGNTQSGLNGSRTVVTVPSATSFTTSVALGTAGTGGTVTLTRGLPPIAFDADESAFRAALVAHGATTAVAANFGVVRNPTGNFVVTFQGALGSLAITTITATQNLSVPTGFSGTLSCNTAGVLELLGTNSEVATNLQITITESGEESDAAQTSNAILRKSLIPRGAVGSNPLSTSLTSINVGNTLFVDSTNGSAGGIRGRLDKPFDTITNAVAAASARDLIWVWPNASGSPYTDTDVQHDGEIHLCDGVEWDSVSDSVHITYAIDMSVTGFGSFHPGGAVMKINNAGASISMRGKHVTVGDHCFNQQEGTVVFIDFDVVDATTSNNAIYYWDSTSTSINGGDCKFHARKLIAGSGDYGAVYTKNGNGTENLYFHFDEIVSTGGSNFALSTDTGLAGTRVWFHCDFLNWTGNGNPAVLASSGKVYYTGFKALGGIQAGSGNSELHVTLQKHNGALTLGGGLFNGDIGILDDAGMSGVPFVNITGGTNFLKFNECARANDDAIFTVAGGDTTVYGGNAVASAGNVFAVDATAGAGTIRFVGTRIDARANTNGIAIELAPSGCTVILQAAILLAGSSGSTIEPSSGTPTVITMGSWGNRASGATMSPVAGWTVNSAVI